MIYNFKIELQFIYGTISPRSIKKILINTDLKMISLSYIKIIM